MINSNIKPTLLVLAAGMGSRYGGLKQMDAFGPNGETILDYSIYDAIREGYGKVVFVIRKSFEMDFRDFFAGKFEDKIEVEYVFQELDDLPEGSISYPDREKPWGTAHAVWVARHVVNEPFAVINADDFYGRMTFKVLADHFRNTNQKDYILVSYPLQNTLSEHGTVNRGVCSVSDKGELESIVETLKIGYNSEGTIVYPDGNHGKSLAGHTPVSMNFWGFYPDYFAYAEEYFEIFLLERGNELKSEFFIPLLIEELMRRNEKSVAVLSSEEAWFGVTYQDDKPIVIDKLTSLIEDGVYPQKLWD